MTNAVNAEAMDLDDVFNAENAERLLNMMTSTFGWDLQYVHTLLTESAQVLKDAGQWTAQNEHSLKLMVAAVEARVNGFIASYEKE